MSGATIMGSTVSLVGAILWVYGLVGIGNPPLVDWYTDTPYWIADFLPDIEAEIGIVLLIGGSLIALYWPTQ
jgi:hypothetical protein